jgi:hypothetical protein
MSTTPAVLMNQHLKEGFKEYIKDKYTIKRPELLENADVLQMLYALEWYEVPRKQYADLVVFHPYLTEDDFFEIDHIIRQHRIENGICFMLISLVSNRLA